MPTRKPLTIINSVAPIRVCDNGGWTDTWFAGHGRIFNIGVYPYAEVQMAVFPDGDQQERIVINAENYGERYVVNPEKHWDKHPLLEAAIAYMRVPKNLSFEVTIYSEAPGGASTGTSAAVTVALIGALDSLTPGRMTPHEVALAAQRIETEMLHQQCGIQDQLCAAYGGINYIEMYQYPHASVSPIVVPNSIWWELERRLVLIYLGKSHQSSAVHEMVIRGLENAGPDCQQLQDLRGTAPRSRDALYAGDFAALGAGDDGQHRSPAPPASRSDQPGASARDRHRARARRAGLEGQRRGRRRRLGDDPVRRCLAGEARHDPRDRAGECAVQKHSAVSEPVWAAGVEAGVPRSLSGGPQQSVKFRDRLAHLTGLYYSLARMI